MTIDHIGLVTDKKHEGETFVEATRVWVTDFASHPYNIEWLRFEPDSPCTGPVREGPHIAFRVTDIEAAASGMETLIEPFESIPGKTRVGFYRSGDGAVIEFIQDIEPAAWADVPSRRALMLEGSGRVYVGSIEIPPLGPTDIGLDVTCSLVSPGTEMADVVGLRQSPRQDLKPFPFGYSNTGIVRAVGRQVTNVKPGERVAAMGSGFALHADRAVIPSGLVVRIPEGVTDEQAAFMHLGATSLMAVRRSELQFGENVLVVGLGIVGNLAGQFAKLCGCHVIGSDLHASRRNIAMNSGFDAVLDPSSPEADAAISAFTRDRGLDCAILCVGGEASAILKTIYRWMKCAPDGHRYGRIVIPGGSVVTTPFAASLGNIDLRSSARTGPGYRDEDYESGLPYPPVFVPWDTRRNLEEFMRAIVEKQLLIDPLITHRMPLEAGPEMCDRLIASPSEAMGVVLTMQDTGRTTEASA